MNAVAVGCDVVGMRDGGCDGLRCLWGERVTGSFLGVVVCVLGGRGLERRDGVQ